MAKETKTEAKDMTIAEARAYRASRYTAPAAAPMSEQEKREAFRLYWAQEKQKYGQPKNLEEVLWLHLQSTKLDEPSKFEAGLSHFGLKKI